MKRKVEEQGNLTIPLLEFQSIYKRYSFTLTLMMQSNPLILIIATNKVQSMQHPLIRQFCVVFSQIFVSFVSFPDAFVPQIFVSLVYFPAVFVPSTRNNSSGISDKMGWGARTMMQHHIAEMRS
jgi:hypothetical protein